MKKLILSALSLFLFSSTISAQKTVVPIVEMKIKGLLGGIQNGKWMSAKQTAAKLKNKTEFVIVGLNGVAEGGVTLGSIVKPEVPCEDFYGADLELKQNSGVAVGSGAEWNFVPRVPESLDTTGAAYTKIVSDLLKSKGIAKPSVKIEQILRVDLEGDGQKEVLITATRYSGATFAQIKAGNYSFVLLRKIVGGKAQNILINGEFYTKAAEFAAPNKHQISAIADLNGDGKMEIVIYGEYYEGNWVEAYEIKGNKPTKVLQTGCGV